jgi:hypothetical protein
MTAVERRGDLGMRITRWVHWLAGGRAGDQLVTYRHDGDTLEENGPDRSELPNREAAMLAYIELREDRPRS